MEQYISINRISFDSINESPLDDLEIKVTDDGARYIDHGPIFVNLMTISLQSLVLLSKTFCRIHIVGGLNIWCRHLYML